MEWTAGRKSEEAAVKKMKDKDEIQQQVAGTIFSKN
jgi:hypothetical protein